MTPEDLAESMKALVDTHNIVVPLQGDEPAHPHMAVDSPDQETNIAVFMAQRQALFFRGGSCG